MSLRLEGVSKAVGGEPHLDGIDLELRPGRLHVLLGPTLAGKTSLLRLMAGLDRPTAGRVLEGGRDVTGVPPRRRRVAMVYQQFVNYPSFTVHGNIASPLRRQGGLSAREIDARVREAAATLGLDGLLGRLPAELSGGQQQRCAIARALVKEADILLLDEPLVNLDYKLREGLRAELKALFARRAGTVVAYATTEPAEALVMGGEVVLLDRGAVLQTGPTLEVYRRPASTRAALAMSDPPMNLVEGRIEGGEARLGRGVRLGLPPHLRGLAPGAYRFGVRAGELRVRRAGEAVPVDADAAGASRPEGGGGTLSALPAAVELAEVSGSETFVHARHGADSLVARLEGVRGFDLGEPVELLLDARDVFAFATEGALRAAPGPVAAAGPAAAAAA